MNLNVRIPWISPAGAVGVVCSFALAAGVLGLFYATYLIATAFGGIPWATIGIAVFAISVLGRTL